MAGAGGDAGDIGLRVVDGANDAGGNRRGQRKCRQCWSRRRTRWGNCRDWENRRRMVHRRGEEGLRAEDGQRETERQTADMRHAVTHEMRQRGSELLTKAMRWLSGDQEGTLMVPCPPYT